MELKILRIKARMSQAEAAEKVGVNQATVCCWERGEYKPKPASVAKLAEIYGVSEVTILNAVKEAAKEAKKND